MTNLTNIGGGHMDKIDVTKLTQMSNFEVAALFYKYALTNSRGLRAINVGRGNPNWINTQARFAFNRIVEFGMKESLQTINLDDGNLAGYTDQTGIAECFNQFLDGDNPVDAFLKQALAYTRDVMHINQDELVFEWVDGVIGNHYPEPSRSLVNVEKILNRYLEVNLYRGEHLSDKTKVFPTEGGTAAMVYLFNELKVSHILEAGDTIAINTPIFTPYLQIPELNEFKLQEFNVSSDESDDWQLVDHKFEELKDPNVKAFFVVNPTNPTSRAFSDHALDKLKEVVEANPNLVIITDDVYGTFVDDFKTIYSVVPHNTLLVYSFSKLYGATGQRIGLIAMHDDNIFDKLIEEMTAEDPVIREAFRKRYSYVTNKPHEMSFIDRTVADSRNIGLYHAAGLSTPQQITMALFSLTNLIYEGREDPYVTASKEIVSHRYKAFWESLGLVVKTTEENAEYYTVFSIYKLAESKYSKDFRAYLEQNCNHLAFEWRLAAEYGVVVMDGAGMGTKAGYLRISLANRPDKDYETVGGRISDLLASYYTKYLQSKAR